MPSCVRTPAAFVVLALISGAVALADELDLNPAKDNTLYEKSDSLSNGVGVGLFAGRTGDGHVVRGLLAFDLRAIPPGSTIEDVSLTLRQTNSGNNNPQSRVVSLHRLSRDWGEGTSEATLGGGGGGGGGPATVGDATWLHNFFETGLWANAGGDFAAETSGSAEVAANGDYVWQSARLVDDVQRWVDLPELNFGWLLRGDEETVATAKRFGSRESSSPPLLIIKFATPGNGPDLTQTLYFPQFGNGEGFFSRISLLNPDSENAVFARVVIREDNGGPFSVVLSGSDIPDGIVRLKIPPGGIRILQTNASGVLLTGSVSVFSSAPLCGAVLFGGAFGSAGTLAGSELSGGFVGPANSLGDEVRTGVAIQNLGENEVTVQLELLDAEGVRLARTELHIPGLGKVARFVDEMEWDNPIDFSELNGSLRVATPARLAAIMIENRFVNGVSQLATLPVLGLM